MRLIFTFAAFLLFCAGIMVGDHGLRFPAATAQDHDFQPEEPQPIPQISTPSARQGSGLTGRTRAATAADSNSNNRFVAVTCPVGSGESVLFLIDAKTDHVAVYGFKRGGGLKFLAARMIDYDLKITGYADDSAYSRDDMKALYHKQAARATAKALKNNGRAKSRD